MLESISAPSASRHADASVTPTLAVVVVAYQCRELLERCLQSVARHAVVDGEPAETWVIDNGSDGSAEMVEERFPDARVHRSPSNVGFARAVNFALRRTSARYVLLLNPDAELWPRTVDRLVALLDRDPRVGIAGCRLVRPDGTLDHAARRRFPTLLGAIGHLIGIGRSERAPRALAQYRAPESEQGGPVDAVNGALMMLRRAALDEVGLLDERFWLYGEDLDLCYRFHQRGWTVFYDASVSARHLKAGSSGKPRRGRANRAFHYAMYRFYAKHYAPRRSVAANAAVYAGIGVAFAASLARSAVVPRLARPAPASRSQVFRRDPRTS